MPTASSAHMRRRIARRATQTAIRYLIFFTFLITISHIRPVPSNSAPATTKSERFQFTSSVNCMAINGMSNIIIEEKTIIRSLLPFIIIKFHISSIVGSSHICGTCHLYAIYLNFTNPFQNPQKHRPTIILGCLLIIRSYFKDNHLERLKFRSKVGILTDFRIGVGGAIFSLNQFSFTKLLELI